MLSEKIHIFDIPVSLIQEDEIEKNIITLLSEKEARQICFLSYKDLMKTRFSREYKACFKNSSMNICISPALPFAAAFLGLKKPKVFNPFTFTIRLLGALEKNGKSIYILGSKKENIIKSESNLKASFPKLQIVGRYAGRFSAEEEPDVLTAIRKSSPTLLLTGKGIKGNNLWLYRQKSSLPEGLSLWGLSCFEVFSGKKSKPTNSTTVKLLGKAILSFLLPWRLLEHLLFFSLLIAEKIKSR